MKQIYLDNAATTQPSKEVILAMDKVLENAWGNPSSIHSVGQEANAKLHEARETVAEFLNCDFQEVIFTGGGSESDNLAIRGIIEKSIETGEKRPHVITSQTEHHAVLHTVTELEKEGKIEATYLKPTKSGVIEPAAVKKAIQNNTVLVSIMYVNNETGEINPINEIAKIVSGQKGDKQIYFHTDAVQAASYLPMDVKELGVDLLTFTAHKVHGPKGVGVLYLKEGTQSKPEITGGGQEFGKRAGTENLASIIGLATAVGEIRGTRSNDRIERLRDKLVDILSKTIPDSILNGADAKRAPHIANISFLNAEGEAIILSLDFLGIAVSSGSACTSHSLEPSHVLSAMGIPPEKTHGAIRFSLSRYTKEEEIDKVIEVLPGIIEKLRAMSPFNN